MRLLITAAVPVSGRTADLCVDLPRTATVADMARNLAEYLGLHSGVHLDAGRSGRQGLHGLLGVVSRLGDTGPQEPVTTGDTIRTSNPGTTGELQRVHSPGGVIGLPGGENRFSGPSPQSPPTPGKPRGSRSDRRKETGEISLWLDGRELDRDQLVVTCPIRNGDVVGVGGAVPDVLAEPDGIVEIRVASGPGSGRVLRLTAGEYAIGAAEDCTLPLQEPDLPGICLWLVVNPRGHVTITPVSRAMEMTRPPADPGLSERGPIVTAAVGESTAGGGLAKKSSDVVKRVVQRESITRTPPRGSPGRLLIDPSMDRPLIHLDRAPVTGRTRWCSGVPLVVGDSMLELSSPAKEDLVLPAVTRGGSSSFARPRRKPSPCYNTRFRMVDGEQGKVVGTDDHDLVAGIGPGAALGGQPRRRKPSDRQRREAQRAQVEERVYRALAVERLSRRNAAPDPGTVLLLATGPRERLWERRREDHDWLVVRVGTADQDSEVELRVSSHGAPTQTVTWTAPDVPVCLPLAAAGTVGLYGPPQRRRASACWIVAQIAALHAPDDVEFVMLTDAGSCSQWRWLRWLPHIRGNGEDGPLIRVGTDAPSIARRLLELRQLIEVRARARQESGGEQGYHPVVVLLDGCHRILGLPEARRLLTDGPPVGVLLICLDDDKDMLPRADSSVGWIEEKLRVHLPGGTILNGVRPDEVGAPWCERFSRSLCALELQREDEVFDPIGSPSSVLEELDSDNVLRNWQEKGQETRVVLGRSSRGNAAVDIVKDGPHGLVVGTAGAGKSHVLRRLIRSLAVDNRPEDLGLLFVGDSEVIEEHRGLPHVIGVIGCCENDETRRVVSALKSLLSARRAQMNRLGVQNFEEYLSRELPKLVREPRILVVADDFTKVHEKNPRVAMELIRLARESRSHGLHLVISTRYPIGVVGAGNAPYSNWRVALRVTDPAESETVIDVQDAARIPRNLPGRAFLRRGGEEPVLFQVHDAIARQVSSVRLCSLAWERMGRSASQQELRDLDTTRFVSILQEADRRMGSCRLPSFLSCTLPTHVALKDLPSMDSQDVVDPSVPPLPIGLLDLPEEQDRGVAYWGLRPGGNLLVTGSTGSGRSSTLWTLASSVASHCSSRDVHLYAIDSGEGTLIPLARLPHMGAAVGKEDPERMRRLLEHLRREISRRNEILDTQGYANIIEQREGEQPEDRFPFIVLFLDHWEGHVATFSRVGDGSLIDPVIDLLQDGGRAGVLLVIAAGRGGIVGRLPSLIDEKIVLRLDDPGDYLAAGLPADRLPESLPPGRCFSFLLADTAREHAGEEVRTVRRGENVREAQIALVTVEQEPGAAVAALEAIAGEAEERDLHLSQEHRPVPVNALPARVVAEEISELKGDPIPATSVSLGIGGNGLDLIFYDVVDHGPGLLITGPTGSGKSTALAHLAREAGENGWSPVVLAASDEPFSWGPGRSFPVHCYEDHDLITDLRTVLEKNQERRLILIDDAEKLRDDRLLQHLSQWYTSLGSARDALVVSCALSALGDHRKGPLPSDQAGGAVLLLSPPSRTESCAVGVPLPENFAAVASCGRLLPGRGLLMTRSGQHWLQVPVHQ